MKKKKKNFTILGLVILLAVFCTAAFMTIPKAEEKRELPDPTNNPSEKITPTPDSESNITGFQNKDTNYSSVHVIKHVPLPQAPYGRAEESLDGLRQLQKGNQCFHTARYYRPRRLRRKSCGSAGLTPKPCYPLPNHKADCTQVPPLANPTQKGA